MVARHDQPVLLRVEVAAAAVVLLPPADAPNHRQTAAERTFSLEPPFHQVAAAADVADRTPHHRPMSLLLDRHPHRLLHLTVRNQGIKIAFSITLQESSILETTNSYRGNY